MVENIENTIDTLYRRIDEEDVPLEDIVLHMSKKTFHTIEWYYTDTFVETAEDSSYMLAGCRVHISELPYGDIDIQVVSNRYLHVNDMYNTWRGL